MGNISGILPAGDSNIRELILCFEKDDNVKLRKYLQEGITGYERSNGNNVIGTQTLFDMAIMHNSCKKCCYEMIDYQRNINAYIYQDNHHTMLYWALIRIHENIRYDIVKRLLERGASPTIEPFIQIVAEYHYAGKENITNGCLELLIKHKANMIGEGFGALETIIKTQNKIGAEMLIENIVDINNNRAILSLILSMLNKNIVTKKLIDCGVNLDIRKNYNRLAHELPKLKKESTVLELAKMLFNYSNDGSTKEDLKVGIELIELKYHANLFNVLIEKDFLPFPQSGGHTMLHEIICEYVYEQSIEVLNRKYKRPAVQEDPESE